MVMWAEFQRQTVERFEKQAESNWVSSQEFWKHLVTIEATILGLTVGLMGSRGESPSPWLSVSWITMLFAIAIGSVLIKTAIDSTMEGNLRGFRTAYDIAGIQARVEEGELDPKSEEYQGLTLAAMMQAPPRKAEVSWTQKTEHLAQKYQDKLPSAFVSTDYQGKLTAWFSDRMPGVQTAFYWASVIAFFLMILSVVL